MRIALLASAHKVHTWRWTRWLADHGCEVFLLSDVPAASWMDMEGVNVVYPTWSILRKAYHFKLRQDAYTNNREKWRAYRRAINDLKPDILHAHDALNYGPTLAHFPGIPRVLTPWGIDMETLDGRDGAAKRLVRQAIDAADVVTTNAPGMGSEWSRKSGKPVEAFQLFSWGVDTALFRPMGTAEAQALLERELPSGFLLSPRLAKPHYRIPAIIAAWSASGKPAPLVVLRAGADDISWNEILAYRQDGLHLIAESLTPLQMAAIHSLARGAINWPTSDLLAMTILETLACGGIPIAPQLTCYSAAISSYPSPGSVKGTGFLANDPTDQALAAQIRKWSELTPDDFAAIGRHNRQYIMEHHRADACMSRMLDIYNGLLGGE